jgi:hypothetical protein
VKARNRKKQVTYETPTQAALAGDLKAFLGLGGMRALEREAMQAARQTIRQSWLPLLESWRAAYADIDGARYERAILDTEIRTLRQQLRIKQTIEQRRAKTLARVRKHRAAKKAAAARLHRQAIRPTRAHVDQNEEDVSRLSDARGSPSRQVRRGGKAG